MKPTPTVRAASFEGTTFWRTEHPAGEIRVTVVAPARPNAPPRLDVRLWAPPQKGAQLVPSRAGIVLDGPAWAGVVQAIGAALRQPASAAPTAKVRA